MGRPLKIMKLGAGAEGATTGKDIGFPLVSTLTAPVTPDGLDTDQFYGVVGGDITTSNTAEPGPNANNPVVSVRVFIAGESEEDGFILRQKGSRQYLVEGASSGAQGVCTLSDEADTSLTSGNMTITVLPGDSSAVRLKKLTNKWCLDWSDNRYFVNFFQGTQGETAIKSGAYQNGTTTLAKIESTNN